MEKYFKMYPASLGKNSKNRPSYLVIRRMSFAGPFIEQCNDSSTTTRRMHAVNTYMQLKYDDIEINNFSKNKP